MTGTCVEIERHPLQKILPPENLRLEPAKKFILDSKQAEIIALQENLFEKKDFLKKIGSNRILRERELVFEPRGAWQILLKSALSARKARAEALCAEATNAEHTIWLPN